MSTRKRISAVEQCNQYGTRECAEYRQRVFDRFPAVEEDIARGYIAIARRGKTAYRDANRWIARLPETLVVGPWNVTHDDDALVEHAKAQARAVEEFTARAYARDKHRVYVFRPLVGCGVLVWPVMSFSNAMRFMARAASIEEKGGLWSAIHVAEDRCDMHGITPPSEKKHTLKARVLRMSDPKWWRRQLRVLSGRKLEQFMRSVGRVHKHAGIYASDITVSRRRRQHSRNTAMLETVEAINQYGQAFTLKELSDKGLANKDNRRAELMLRIRDTEQEALKAGHVGMFYTLTCPSKYHPVLAKSCQPNPKYNNTTPSEAQDYLTGIWAQMRARFADAGVGVYGVRVVEPHHDGTPHWHMLLFMHRDHYETVTTIMRRIALNEDGSEHGAKHHRFKVEEMDQSKGGAISYIAKYICKNINGQQFSDYDQYGKPMEDAAPRIDAWAAVWGIRQFQFAGMPGVTVWREMRRISEATAKIVAEWEELFGYSSTVVQFMRDLRVACDNGEWDRYLRLMGGPMTPRSEQPVKLWAEVRLDPERQDGFARGGYGENVQVCYGIRVLGHEYMTRFFKWTTRPVSGVGGEGSESGKAASWTRVNNCTPTISEVEGAPAADDFLQVAHMIRESTTDFDDLPAHKQIEKVREHIRMTEHLQKILTPQPKSPDEVARSEKLYQDWLKSPEYRADVDAEGEMEHSIAIQAASSAFAEYQQESYQ